LLHICGLVTNSLPPDASVDALRRNPARLAALRGSGVLEFLASMGHELRTPLNAISGHIQLIEMGVHGPVTDGQHAALARVQRNQQHLLELVSDLLNFAALQAGRVEYSVKAVDLASLVEDLTPMIEGQVAAKRVSYTVSVDPEVVVRADPGKLRAVLLNLLTNAVDFADAGGRVTVESVERPDRSPGVVYLRVSDSSAGFARDQQDAIFDAFVPPDREHGPVSAGAGLGLAISLDLARGMGGNLRVRSVVGSGSTFTLTLPIA
jgi:signal transduction histidine kinase